MSPATIELLEGHIAADELYSLGEIDRWLGLGAHAQRKYAHHGEGRCNGQDWQGEQDHYDAVTELAARQYQTDPRAQPARGCLLSVAGKGYSRNLSPTASHSALFQGPIVVTRHPRDDSKRIPPILPNSTACRKQTSSYLS